MKKRILSIVLVLTMLISTVNITALTAFAADTKTASNGTVSQERELTAADSGATLSSGLYYVKSDLTLNADKTQYNGLKIADGATVYINIPSGVTLTVYGGNGTDAGVGGDATAGSIYADKGTSSSWNPNINVYGNKGAAGTVASTSTGGGAAIYVPSGATLILLGDGSVKAFGGAGGNAGAGGSGSATITGAAGSYATKNGTSKKLIVYLNGTVDSSFDSSEINYVASAAQGRSNRLNAFGGCGGAGGAGAAGGGSGIGTNGADGAGGNAGGTAGDFTDDTIANAVSGAFPNTTVSPAGAGTIKKSADISITAEGGQGGSAGTIGTGADLSKKQHKFGLYNTEGNISTQYFNFYNGQPGAGGGAGGTGAGIGTGGQGGAGGQGGYSGTLTDTHYNVAQGAVPQTAATGTNGGNGTTATVGTLEESDYPAYTVTFLAADGTTVLKTENYYTTKTESIAVPVYSGTGFSGFEVVTAATDMGSSISPLITAGAKLEKTATTVSTDNICGNVTVKAVIKTEYTITVETDGNGTANTDKTKAYEGDTVTLNASPNTGYQFREWQVTSPSDGLTVANNTFTMPEANVTVKAVFEAIPIPDVKANNVEVTYDGQGHGIMVTAPEGATVTYGTSKDNCTSTESPKYTEASDTAYTVYYKVSLDGYEDYIGSATVKINRKDVTVTPDAMSKTYGENDPTAFTYKAEGLVSGDTLEGALGREKNEQDNAGTFSYTLGTLSSNNYNIKLAENAPKFTVKPRPIEVKWSEKTALTYNGSTQGIYPTVANTVGGDKVNLTVTGNTAKEVNGRYTATVTGVDNDNYTVEGGKSLTKEWSISYLATDAVLKISGEKKIESSDWFTGDVTLTAPEGYTFSFDDGKTWLTTYTITENGELKYYQLKNTDGYITDEKAVNVNIDKDAPTGEIKVRENGFKSFINKITFGFFFKNSVDVTITAEDGENSSGIKSIEYQKVAKGETYDENGTWTAYEAFSIKANEKCVIYAKITDNAGNVTYLSTDGLVVYQDVEVTKDEQTYVRGTKRDVLTNVNVGENTIEAIAMLPEGDTTSWEYLFLPDGSYRVNTDGYLVLDGAFLDKACEADDWEFSVVYKPLDEKYDDTSKGDIPAYTDIILHVVRQAGTVKITNVLDKVYDGDAVADPVISTGSTAKAVVMYKPVGAEDSAYTAEKPVNVGTYTVKVSVPQDENYTEVNFEKTFTISKADGTVAIENDISKTYDGKAVAAPETSGSHTADVKVEYKVKGADDRTYTETAPVKAGEYTVRVTLAEGENYKAATATKDFTVEKAEAVISVADENESYEKTYGDEAFTLEGISKTGESEITFKSNDEKVVTVDENGKVTIIGQGETTVTLSMAESENYKAAAFDVTVKVNPKDITGAVVTLGDRLTANGKEQEQQVKSVVVDGMEVTFTVTDNKQTEAGKYTLKITGTGNFTGTIEKTFVVMDAEKPADEGKVTVNVKVDENAPATQVTTPKSELMNLVMDANDAAAVADGAELDIWVEAKDAKDTITEESKKQIADSTDGYKIGQYIDISLFKKLSTETEATQITGTAKNIKITITIPADLVNSNDKVNRAYAIVRNHEGKVEVLDTVYDGKNQTLTFETDKFSDYAIVYKDTDKPVTPTSPQTGDNSNLWLWVVLMVLSSASLAFMLISDRRRKTAKH